MTPKSHERVAIVGGGISGIAAAHMLQHRYRVTLFEKNDYVGGHTNTIVAPDISGVMVPVDTGFIVLNDRTYPNFEKFLAQLKVPVQDSDMSFAVWDRSTNLQYNGTDLDGLFAQRRNLLRPSFLRMLGDILRFNKQAQRDFASGSLSGQTLHEYVAAGKYSEVFQRLYLLPMSAAIWSTPPGKMGDYPAETFVRFCINHGLLSVSDRPQWKTVVGGSWIYVRAFLAKFTGEVRISAPVLAVTRRDEVVEITTLNGERQTFDQVIMASHADETLSLLADADENERAALSPWVFQANEAVLHADESVMPPLKKAWASWNYSIAANEETPPTLTYHMNRLQRLTCQRQFFVTLNPDTPLRDDLVFRRIAYTHPRFDSRSVESQKCISELNGHRRTYYAGAYLGYGFHEDGVKSAIEVARHFGESL